MSSSKEIKALIGLIDDPDEMIFSQIREKIISYGSDVIPHLEAAWEDQSLGAIFQSRIEDIIHKIQFDAVYVHLKRWIKAGGTDLLEGAIILNKYQYPDADDQAIRNEIEKIRQDIWLELNNELTAFEEVRIFNYILFELYGFDGNKQNFHSPTNSFIKDVIETRKGNPLSLSIIYSILAQQLNVPIQGVNLPSHFVLAYRDEQQIMQMIGEEHSSDGVMFYINPFSRGTIFNRKEIDQFLKQINLDPAPQYYTPCTNIDMIKRVVSNLIYSYQKLEDQTKIDELLELKKLFD